MSAGPVICLGQQPCGFFPRRFLAAKFATARRLQAELGGEIVFFYHDSDHDPRETQTLLRHRRTGEPATLNFVFENRLQRKWSPLHFKRIPAGWQAGMLRQLGAYVPADGVHGSGKRVVRFFPRFEPKDPQKPALPTDRASLDFLQLLPNSSLTRRIKSSRSVAAESEATPARTSRHLQNLNR
jgi:hypothetical protein